MVTRRTLLAVPLAAVLPSVLRSQNASNGRMLLSIHQNTFAAAGPRELIDNDSRIIPGDGIAPVERIIRKLTEKNYAGALSVELFRADIVNADPFDAATEIREKCEAVMRDAEVL